MSDLRTELSRWVDPSTLISWLPGVLRALLVVVVVVVADRVLQRSIRYVMGQVGVDDTAVAFAQNVTRYALFTLAFITALAELGVDVTGILASLGVVGLTVGFAARDALSNIISGLFIFWDRPFVIGDLVEIGDKYGRVQIITMRSTRVVTVDGRMLAIPNTTILNGIVASYTNFPHLRIDVDVGVAVTSNLAEVRRLMLATVADDEAYLDEPPPRVVVAELADDHVTMSLQAWLSDEREHIAARAALREKVFDTLNAEGVEMPFPTISLRPIEVRGIGA